MTARRRIDCHVNVLPEWTADAKSTARLRGELPGLRRHFSHPNALALHAKCGADKVGRTLAANRVFAGIATPFQFRSEPHCREASKAVAVAVAQNPGRLFGLAVVQPRSRGAAEQLDGWLSRPGMIGLKLKPKWGGFSLRETRLLGPLMEVVHARGGIVLTHISQPFHASEGDNPDDLLAFLRAYPRITVVAAHFGGFLGLYSCYRPVGRHFENLFIDISLPSNLVWLRPLMERDDPSRYLYATDFPFMSHAALDRALKCEARLTDRQLELVSELNPCALLSRAGVKRSRLN